MRFAECGSRREVRFYKELDPNHRHGYCPQRTQGFTAETQSAQGTPPANGPLRPAGAARRRSPLAGDLAGMPAERTQAAPHLPQEKGAALKERKDSPQRRRVRRAPKAPHPQTDLDDPQEPLDVGARLRATWQGCQRNRRKHRTFPRRRVLPSKNARIHHRVAEFAERPRHPTRKRTLTTRKSRTT
jgi:hypothetical protein